MSAGFEPYRQVVSSRDGDYSVRFATFEDVVRLQQEAHDLRLNARWSSEDALRAQVEPGTKVFLAPMLRNGRDSAGQDSYRCHIWFVQRADPHKTTLSCFDVTAASLSALPELSPDQFRRLVRMPFDALPLDAIG